MSAVWASGRAGVCFGVLGVKNSFRTLFTQKMAEKSAEYTTANGFESKTPFLIGVAGGTASGKVSMNEPISSCTWKLLIFSTKLELRNGFYVDHHILNF